MSEKLPKIEDEQTKKLPEMEKMIVEDLDLEEMYKNMPITDDTRCGIGLLQGKFLQRWVWALKPNNNLKLKFSNLYS